MPSNANYKRKVRNSDAIREEYKRARYNYDDDEMDKLAKEYRKLTNDICDRMTGKKKTAVR